MCEQLVKRHKIPTVCIFRNISVTFAVKASKKMASIQDLPDEIILKVTHYLEIKDLVKLGEVSKKMRIVSSDQSLWKRINLSWIYQCWSYEIDVPTDFVKMVLKNGCQYLSLQYMKLGNPGEPISMTSEGDLCIDKPSRLRYLDLQYCDAHVLTFEAILASCHSLQKLSMASKPYKKKQKNITSKMMQSICYQNGSTLQSLNLSCCHGLDLESIQNITKNCVGLKNLDLLATRLSKDSINFLVNNLTPEVEKLAIGRLSNLKDGHVKSLVTRCNKLSILNLQKTTITYDSLTHIIENLQHTLVKLDLSWCDRITYTKLTKLKSMTKLRVLNCDKLPNFHGQHEQENLQKSIPLVDFGEPVCVDERELSPADGIWDVETEKLEYFRKFAKCQFGMLPNELISHCLTFLERRNFVKFGQVSKRMRFITCNMSCICQISPCVHARGRSATANLSQVRPNILPQIVLTSCFI